MFALILSMTVHQGGADPDLLAWIKDRLDHLIGLEPWTVVVLIGLLILTIPLSVMALFLIQQRRAFSGNQGPEEDV